MKSQPVRDYPSEWVRADVSEPTDADRIRHMQVALRRLNQVVAPASLADLLASEDKQAAACRSFSVLGTAARAVSAKMKRANPQIAWRRWSFYGNLLLRRYDRVNYPLMWQKYQSEVPALRAALAKLSQALGVPQSKSLDYSV